ncbi:hypothetical protein [Streptomyces sp. NPDC126499]|uniref:hypothetical protein n=1 Tax=Streptomyces sp. NPDC126499 TaxID=3155314 RepID=UPI00332BD650
MPTSQSALDSLRTAQDVVTQLRAELAAHGVTLPSLGVDPLTMAATAPAYPLVELGRCNLDTARRLVSVLAEARA